MRPYNKARECAGCGFERILPRGGNSRKECITPDKEARVVILGLGFFLFTFSAGRPRGTTTTLLLPLLLIDLI